MKLLKASKFLQLLIFMIGVSACQCEVESVLPEPRVVHPSHVGSGSTILLISQDLIGHTVPLVNLGQELQFRGHNVYLVSPWVSSTNPWKLLIGTGLGYIPAGVNLGADVAPEKGIHGPVLSGKLSPFALFVYIHKVMFEQNAGMTRAVLNLGILQSRKNVTSHPQGSDKPAVPNIAADPTIVLRHDAVQPDLIIADTAAGQTGEVLATIFGIPLVYNNNLFHFEASPSFTLPMFSSRASIQEMSLLDRLKGEVWQQLRLPIIAILIARWQVAATIKKKYNLSPVLWPPPGVVRPYLQNFAFDYPLPLGPLIVRTGPLLFDNKLGGNGIDVRKRALEKSPGLRDWLESWPPRSVVAVSMGSLVKLTPQQGAAILEGLVLNGQPAVWALRPENRHIIANLSALLASIGGRIRLENWMPQQAILAHQATAVLMGHCGAGGVQEALSQGVPVLCLPFFLDQPGVAARLRQAGAGLSLDPWHLTASGVAEALGKLTRNASCHHTGARDAGHCTWAPSAGGSEGACGNTAADSQPCPHNLYVAAAQRIARYMRSLGGVEKAADVAEYVLAVGSTEDLVMPSDSQQFAKALKLDIYGALLALLFLVVISLRAIVLHRSAK